MGTLHTLGSAPRGRRRGGAPARPEAQALLDVPAAYGGRGAWIDRRSWPQLQRFLDRCREDVALHHPTQDDAAARLLAALDHAGQGIRSFLAGLFDSDGELCACVDVVRSEPDDGSWWIGLIVVRPDLRGRGIGAALVEAIEGWVRAEGGRSIFLALQRRNAPALHFARRTGFVPHAEAAAPAGKLELLVRRVA